jgi:tellurite resistance protein
MIGVAAPVTRESAGYLSYLPVGLFGAVMGLTGLSAAWRLAHFRYGVPQWIGDILGVISIGVFLAVSIAYAVKCLTAKESVMAEFRHPIAGNMFGTIFVSMLLLPIVVAPLNIPIARALWLIGALGIVGFAWLMATRWLRIPQNRSDVTPAWIIPVIGILDIPLAVPALGLGSLHGVMVFGLAVGLVFATPLFTLIFQRQLFEPPMPDALKPSLLILAAPAAVGFSSYVATAGQQDLFAESLYVVTLFLLAILLGHLRHLPACCPFRLSWWAVSFPLAASAIAGLRFASSHSGWAANGTALALLALVTLVIGWLFVRTLSGIAHGELRALSL